MYKGNDPIALGVENKEGILTAEQVKVSFDSVGGRMISENVQEAQFVKKGDVLMVLDSTDMDIAIAQLEAQIENLNAQINGTAGTINLCSLLPQIPVNSIASVRLMHRGQM